MATTVNYTSLVQDITNYIERGGSSSTDPTVFAQIPRLINAAERKIAQDLKLLGQIEVLVDAPAGLQQGNPVLTKPDRWRGTASINYGSGTNNNSRTPLLPRGYEFCRYYWPDSTVMDVNQPPLFYGDYDYQHYVVVPTPPADYPLEMICYMQPVLLDSTNETNFFTNYTPNLLLYGALCEAEPFIKDDARVQLWQGYWKQEIETLSQQDLQRIMDRAVQRKTP